MAGSLQLAASRGRPRSTLLLGLQIVLGRSDERLGGLSDRVRRARSGRPVPACETGAVDEASPGTVVEVRTRLDRRDLLDDLARRLVDDRLAACVHVRGPERTVYRWQGVVVDDDEYELHAVTAVDRVDGLVRALGATHPYEVPSVLARTCRTTAAYGDWVIAETRPVR